MGKKPRSDVRPPAARYQIARAPRRAQPIAGPAAAALEESEARLRRAQRVAKLGSWELDIQSGALSWTEEIFRIFEIEPDGFGASYEDFLALVPPEDRVRVDEAYRSSVANRTPYEITHRIQMRDGRTKWVEERCETTYGDDGAPLRSVGTVQDVTARVKAERAMETLLREVHHRVKNNLQVICSLLALKGRALSDETARLALRDCEDRVRLIALIHEQLYQSPDVSEVDIGSHLRGIAATMSRTHSPDVHIRLTSAPGILLGLDAAIPMGLILHELLSNAFKHAFPHGRGVVELSCTRVEEGVALRVRDDGVGIPVGSPTRGHTGLTLVEGLTAQVGGRFEIRADRGTIATVVVPCPAPKSGAGGARHDGPHGAGGPRGAR
jgi:two-component system, sensor histidine kinase PdtaS